MELAQTAWDAYSAAVGGRAFNGDLLPNWDVMVADPKKQNLVKAWRATAEAVRHEVLLENSPPEFRKAIENVRDLRELERISETIPRPPFPQSS
jgi:hypothetical protein